MIFIYLFLLNKPLYDFLFYFERRERDSNPRYTFGVYTLSRRASSTTRAPLPRGTSQKRAQITKNISIPLNLVCKFTEFINYNLVRDENILKNLLLASKIYTMFNPNILLTFRLISLLTTITSISHISEILLTIKLKYDDSLRFPL